MALLTRDAILAAMDLLTKDVDVPEWGGTVRVRSMTGAERDRFEATIVEMRGKQTHVDMQNMRAKLVAMCVIGEDGKRLFSSDGDVLALGDKSAAALQRVFEVAQQLSGLSPTDIEELSKN